MEKSKDILCIKTYLLCISVTYMCQIPEKDFYFQKTKISLVEMNANKSE